MRKIAATASADFFARYDHFIQPEPNSGCWLWLGAATPMRSVTGRGGYGCFTHKRKGYYAHRTAFEATNGAGSSDGLMVRHRCDTPLCVNPDHLEIGTNADNGADMAQRGRAHGGYKLTPVQVIEMRKLNADGVDYQTLSEKYGIKKYTVSMICRFKRWKRVRGDTDAIATVMQIRAQAHAELMQGEA